MMILVVYLGHLDVSSVIKVGLVFSKSVFWGLRRTCL